MIYRYGSRAYELCCFALERRLQNGQKVTEMIENIPPKEYNIVIWFNGAQWTITEVTNYKQSSVFLEFYGL